MKRSRQDPRWPEAHVKLKQIYDERAPEGMTQEEFGQTYGIGTQGMVWQYLNGWSPLNFEAAAKFARGLNCTIFEISPSMAKALKTDILPVLGRAAMIAIFLGATLLSPPLVGAHDGFFAARITCVLCKIVSLARMGLHRLVRFLTTWRRLSAC